MKWIKETTTVSEALRVLPGVEGLLKGFRFTIEGHEDETIARLATQTPVPLVFILACLNRHLMKF
jgi:hypothetical protein